MSRQRDQLISQLVGACRLGEVARALECWQASGEPEAADALQLAVESSVTELRRLSDLVTLDARQMV
jgi:hypothetical protein